MSVKTLLVAVSYAFAPASGFLDYPPNGIQASFQVFKRRSKGEPDKLVTGRVKQVAAVGWVDVKEYSGNDDGLFFQQLFKECQTIIQWCRKFF